ERSLPEGRRWRRAGDLAGEVPAQLHRRAEAQEQPLASVAAIQGIDEPPEARALSGVLDVLAAAVGTAALPGLLEVGIRAGAAGESRHAPYDAPPHLIADERARGPCGNLQV